jgi:hypothetical protein
MPRSLEVSAIQPPIPTIRSNPLVLGLLSSQTIGGQRLIGPAGFAVIAF